MSRKLYRFLIPFLLLVFLFSSCNSSDSPTATQPGDPPLSATVAATESLPTVTPSVSATPQPYPASISYGPTGFPTSLNSPTGQRGSGPAQLGYPALLISISHFPPAARPQAGFSFTPWVYEYYITEGSTRHVAVFYGEFPQPEIPTHGECAVRAEDRKSTRLNSSHSSISYAV